MFNKKRPASLAIRCIHFTHHRNTNGSFLQFQLELQLEQGNIYVVRLIMEKTTERSTSAQRSEDDGWLAIKKDLDRIFQDMYESELKEEGSGLSEDFRFNQQQNRMSPLYIDCSSSSSSSARRFNSRTLPNVDIPPPFPFSYENGRFREHEQLKVSSATRKAYFCQLYFCRSCYTYLQSMPTGRQHRPLSTIFSDPATSNKICTQCGVFDFYAIKQFYIGFICSYSLP